MVVIGPNSHLGVDNLAEGLAELNELFLAALPRQVAHVQHLGWGLRVAEVRLTNDKHHGYKGFEVQMVGSLGLRGRWQRAAV